MADAAARVAAERGITYVLMGRPRPRRGVRRVEETLAEGTSAQASRGGRADRGRPARRLLAGVDHADLGADLVHRVHHLERAPPAHPRALPLARGHTPGHLGRLVLEASLELVRERPGLATARDDRERRGAVEAALHLDPALGAGDRRAVGVSAQRVVLTTAWVRPGYPSTALTWPSTPVSVSAPAATMVSGGPRKSWANDTAYTPRSSSAPPASSGAKRRWRASNANHCPWSALSDTTSPIRPSPSTRWSASTWGRKRVHIASMANTPAAAAASSTSRASASLRVKPSPQARACPRRWPAARGRDARSGAWPRKPPPPQDPPPAPRSSRARRAPRARRRSRRPLRSRDPTATTSPLVPSRTAAANFAAIPPAPRIPQRSGGAERGSSTATSGARVEQQLAAGRRRGRSSWARRTSEMRVGPAHLRPSSPRAARAKRSASGSSIISRRPRQCISQKPTTAGSCASAGPSRRSFCSRPAIP